MNNIDKSLLNKITDNIDNQKDAYNIRKNGKTIDRKINEYINIVPKDDNSGLDIYVKENTLFGIIHIPVIISESGLTDIVYNDFHIGKKANVIILAGCGIHNDLHKDSRHEGIHRFYLEESSNVTYSEKNYGKGNGSGQKILNPTTEIYMKKNAKMKIDSVQIKGVNTTNRITKAYLEENATLEIAEKILTNNNDYAKTEFIVELKGQNSSTHVTSRSVATDDSYQEFFSNIIGENKCYAHVECDAILKNNGQVKAIPEIYAKNVEANLIHEAAIGKIAGDQLQKLMTLGLNEKEAEEVIIHGFLK